MRQVNNIIEGAPFWTSESICRCDAAVLLWGICDTLPYASWEQTSPGAAKADNMLGQRDLGICHTVLQVITRTDKLLSGEGFRNSV